MKRSLFVLLLLLTGAVCAHAQTASDPNEGSRISYDRINGVATLSWWGRTGTSYYIQYSEDLITWHYFRAIAVGGGAEAGFNAPSSATRYFMRLETTTNINADSDSDGMPDGWEVLHGLNPHFNDAGGDLDGDGFTNLDEYLFGLNPQVNDFANGVKTQGYIYDDATRLTGVTGILAETFDYDPEGNLKSSL